MSERAPPAPVPVQAQVPTLTPIELFWDRYRNLVYGAVVAVFVVLAAGYMIRHFRQQAESQRWQEFGATTRLASAYGREGADIATLRSNPNPQFRGFFMEQYLRGMVAELLTQLPADLKAADTVRLEQAAKDTAGSPAEPLVLWVTAYHHYQNDDWVKAEKSLDELHTRFPQHFLTVKTDYVPQYREPIEEPKDADPAPVAATKAEPKLKDAVAGLSAVDALRAQIRAERDFRTANPQFFVAPAPEASDKLVEIKTTQGTFVIALYMSKAPKHAEAFLKRVEEKFFDGIHIDELLRPATDPNMRSGQTTTEFHFGLATARDEDREKWLKTAPSTTILDFEESGLSHFPMMVAASPEAGGKSSGERIWINVTDASAQHDGRRVVFGRVVEGEDVVRGIANAPYLTEDENRAGRGKPRDLIKIESVTVR